MFETLTEKLQAIFDKLSSQGRLTEADVDKALREVRMALLEADVNFKVCLLYTSDAADERSSVDLGGRRIIKKKKTITSI